MKRDKAKRAAVKARLAARPPEPLATAPAPEPPPPAAEPRVQLPSRKTKARLERLERAERRKLVAETPAPVAPSPEEGVAFAPVFLDLVPEQDPLVFPDKKKADGTIVHTSKTLGNGEHRRTLVRDPKSVTGITIHQTACVFGPAGDPIRQHRRALHVPAHVTAFRDGVYAQSAPLLWYLYHGNALNERSLALECEGHYPGLLDDPETPRREDEETIWGADATPLGPEQIETFRAALRHLVVEGRKLGCPIKWIWAHRQSSESRRSDPGQALWTEVAEWGVRELGLQARYADVFRDGRPVPREWAAHGVGRY